MHHKFAVRDFEKGAIYLVTLTIVLMTEMNFLRLFDRDIYVRKMTMKTMKYVFWMTGYYGSNRVHPDHNYNPRALPVIEGINYMDMVAENVSMPGYMEGIKEDVFKGICMSNVTIGLAPKPKEMLWNCTNVEGVSSGVTPKPCGFLREKKVMGCPFPEDRLPIEEVKLKVCSVPVLPLRV